jgi:TonB family protein
MREAVSAVLAERARQGDGLSRMLAISLAVHGVLVIGLAAMPADWRSRGQSPLARDVMVVSLGGTPGPRAGGMTPIDARPIQRLEAPPDLRRPEPVRPPAPPRPAMTVPEPRARAARPAPETAGPETRAGTARAETGATRATGFAGLTTGGGGGTGGYVEAGDFCCPEYLATMVSLIAQHWNQFQQVPGETVMKFTIRRDGRITDIELERSSGYLALDLAARRALEVTAQLPALPAEFPEPRLIVHLSFQYKR